MMSDQQEPDLTLNIEEDLEVNKLKLKLWEKEFKNKHGSKPTKNDIKNAPESIKHAYKQYWKSKCTYKSNSDTSKINQTDDKELLDDNSLNCNIKEDVWGKHLNKAAGIPVKDEKPAKSILSHYTSKIQANGAFRKYNPKKLSSGGISQSPGSSSKQSHLTVSEENRATNSITLSEEDTKNEENTINLGFLKGMKVVSKASSIASSPNIQAVNVLSRLLNSETPPSTIKKRCIEKSWLDRCNPENLTINGNFSDDYLCDTSEKEHQNKTTNSFSDDEVPLNESGSLLPNSDCHSKNRTSLPFSPLDVLESKSKSTLLSKSRNSFSSEILEAKSLLFPLTSLNASLKDSVTQSFNCELLEEEFISSSSKSNVSLRKSPESDNDSQGESLCTNKKSPKTENNRSKNTSSLPDSFDLDSKDRALHFILPEKNCTSLNKVLDVNSVDKLENLSLEKTDTKSKDLSYNNYNEEFCKKRKETSFDESQADGQESPTTQPTKRICKNIRKADALPSLESEDNLQSPKGRKIQNLKRKLSTGQANENFVRINLKKKIYQRGKKTFNSRRYKRKQWLNLKRQQRDDDGEPVTKRNACFRCGKLGHWSRNCPGKFEEKAEKLLENADNPEVEESPFLTLDEAAALSKGIKTSQNISLLYNSEPTEEVDEDFIEAELKSTEVIEDLENASVSAETISDVDSKVIKPLLSPGSSEIPDIVYSALRKFGYENFRPGQEEAVRRILCGLSTLVILSTGAGKSLCYQLPAYLYAQQQACITLVISPLVSLMEDQVVGLPACLKAACLHTNLTSSQRQSVHEAISKGKIHVLLISPEAAVSGGESGSGCLPKDLPPIAFACIDEAHCVSEWSHNFRPSYLRLCKVLREKLGIKCILGLTATATQATSFNIAVNLGLPEDSSSIIRGTVIPDNLILSCSRDRSKDEAIIELLKSEKFSQLESIIIYCIRRAQTERIATLIRTNFQDITEFERKGKRRGRALSWNAEAYHAGMTAAKRRAVQNSFMSGKLRIVVATVAFGMGLDKSDVRAVVHYNMPKSFESYVQEIGRAGRDGLPSYCHVFLESQGEDIFELQRHIYSNSVDRSSLRKLLRKVFQPCICHELERKINQIKKSIINKEEANVDIKNKEEIALKRKMCPGHEIAIPIEPLIQELDLKEESIATLLCYLELSNMRLIKQLSPVYATCKLKCYGGNKQLKAASRKCPPLAVAIALDQQRNISHEKSTEIEFPVVEIASRMGWNSGIVKRELKALEWNNELLAGGGKIRRSGILVEFCDLAFHLQTEREVTGDELDTVLDFLNDRIIVQEKTQLYQLKKIHDALKSVSKPNVWDCYESETEMECSNKLKKDIVTYFEQQNALPTEHSDLINLKQKLNSLDDKKDLMPCKKEDQVRRDLCNFLSTYNDQSFSGRSVARIFCGIPSPCYPAEVWGRVRRYWRCHMDVDFNLLTRWAIEEIRKFK